jgi:hypothetical protein
MDNLLIFQDILVNQEIPIKLLNNQHLIIRPGQLQLNKYVSKQYL